MLTYSKGKKTHWYYMEPIGNGIFRESQHFKSKVDAEFCARHKLLAWTKGDGTNTCSVCRKEPT